MTTVELDPDVVDAAYTWFKLPRDPRLRVEVDDGRRFLQRTDERYDVIMVDAFYSDGVPFHLTTLEFVELMRERLTPGGVIATNVIGALTGGSSQITRALRKTYAAVFPTVKLHPVFEAVRSAVGRHPEHHPRRHRARGPTDRAARQLLERDPPGARPVRPT